MFQDKRALKDTLQDGLVRTNTMSKHVTANTVLVCNPEKLRIQTDSSLKSFYRVVQSRHGSSSFAKFFPAPFSIPFLHRRPLSIMFGQCGTILLSVAVSDVETSIALSFKDVRQECIELQPCNTANASNDMVSNKRHASSRVGYIAAPHIDHHSISSSKPINSSSYTETFKSTFNELPCASESSQPSRCATTKTTSHTCNTARKHSKPTPLYAATSPKAKPPVPSTTSAATAHPAP